MAQLHAAFSRHIADHTQIGNCQVPFFFRCSGGTILALPTAEYIGPAKILIPPKDTEIKAGLNIPKAVLMHRSILIGEVTRQPEGSADHRFQAIFLQSGFHLPSPSISGRIFYRNFHCIKAHCCYFWKQFFYGGSLKRRGPQPGAYSISYI